MQPAEKLSFVSGHRFSDAAKRFEFSRPLGAGHRKSTSSASVRELPDLSHCTRLRRQKKSKPEFFRGFAQFSSNVHRRFENSTVFPKRMPPALFPSAPSALIITTRPVRAPNDIAFDFFRQLQRDPQAAGGHRPHRRRLRQAEEGGGAELLRAVSVSCREDAFVFGACHAPVFSLLWLRRVGRRLHLHPEGREHHLSGSHSPARAEARHTDAQAHLLESGGGARRSGSHGTARRACAGYRVFPGMSAASRRSECPRVSQRPRTR